MAFFTSAPAANSSFTTAVLATQPWWRSWW